MIAGEFPFREVMKTYLDRFVLPEYRSKPLLLTDLSANPATRPFWVVAGSGIDVKGNSVSRNFGGYYGF